MTNYTVIHLHSDLSNGVTNIDSVTKYDDYIQYAKELGMKAIAFTEHGSVFSWVNKKLHAEAAGLKYIHGEEFYVTSTLDEKIRDNMHCCLYAKNWEGVKELNALASAGFTRSDNHFYYQPRISLDDVIDTSDNIIISTACLGGILNKAEGYDKERFIGFLAENKHRCFLEIQHHNVKDQIEYNKFLYELHQATGIPLITGTDTHALNKEHAEGRKILQKSKKVNFGDEDGWDLTFKTYDELMAAYKKQKSLPMDVVLEAIQNTNALADMVEEFELDRSYKYPHLWEDSEGTFRAKIRQGIIRRGVDKYPNYQEYLDRIEEEMDSYIHNGAIDFMLLMEDIVDWCMSVDIGIGYGRGSCNGSVIAWLLGITEMDSIKHGLNFQRFMNTERVSLADIDSDLPPSKIEDIKNYIYSKTDLYCCDIITFNTVADKGAIRDVARALDIPLPEVAKICATVDNEEEYAKIRNKHPELFRYVDIVKGTVVSVGTHPCGLVCSPHKLDAEIGLMTTSTCKYPVSQIYMKEIDYLNYVKLDLLKLDTIELINETCKLAGIERLTPDNIDVTDINVWNAMRDDTTQIFQWEGNTGETYIKKLLSDENIEKFKMVNENIDRMTLLSIGNSAIRPAGASYREDLASGVVRTTGSKPIDDFLKPTFGYLVFQCQIIEFLHYYCGFTMGEADIVRRCVDEDTLVTLANGRKRKIKHIKPGDMVMTVDDASFEMATNKVLDVIDNGVRNDCYSVKTVFDYTVKCTHDHKFFTTRGWVKACELTINDELYSYDTNDLEVPHPIPVALKWIKKIDECHVYDLSVENNHNYVGNNLIVHNCFAKKLGTEQTIPVIKNGGYLTDDKKHYIKGYIQTMKEQYGISEEKSEEDIIAFIKVIEDASRYLFSLNHSQPYSYEGYASAWLRYYYPLEFLTTAFNINSGKEEKTKGLTAYAKKCGIEFKSPKFRYSRAGYFCDKETNTIYKGIGSIKYMNDQVSEELYSMAEMRFDDFVDVLYHLKKYSTIDSRQLDILIKIDFFEEFGDIKKLLYITELFSELNDKKQLKKDVNVVKYGIPEEILRKYSKSETGSNITEIDALSLANYLGYSGSDATKVLEKCIRYRFEKIEGDERIAVSNGYSVKKVMRVLEAPMDVYLKFATKISFGRFADIDFCKVLKYMFTNTDIEPCDFAQKMKYQLEHLGYIEYMNPSLDKRYIVVTDLDTKYSPKLKAYCLATGQLMEIKIHSRLNRNDAKIKTSFREIPVEDGDIIYMRACSKTQKQRKVNDEWVPVPGEFNWWIDDYYKVVNDKEIFQ